MKKILMLVIALSLIGLCVVEAKTPYTSAINQSPGIGIIDNAGQGLGTPVRRFRAVRFYYHGTAEGVNGLEGGAGQGDCFVSPDSILIWDTSASGDDGVTVALSAVTGDSRVAGVLVKGISWISTDNHHANASATEDAQLLTNWGWLQTHGVAWVLAGATFESGDAICISGVPGMASRFGTGTMTATTYWFTASLDAAYKGNAGFAMDDATAGSACKVFLKCE